LWIAQQERPGNRDLVEIDGTSGALAATLQVVAGIDVLVFFGVDWSHQQTLQVDLPLYLSTSLSP